jgi:hypothetical protein
MDQLSTASNSPSEDFESYFYSIIDRLKAQKALPQDSFIKDVPFFNFTSISKESQIKELYQDINDPNLYKSLIKNIISLPDEKSPELIAKRLSAMQVMGFAQIMLYKVLPCCEANCPNRPREVATHNQYKDYEYQCPFYHHDKDHRRIVITPNIEEEFIYKANYYEEGKRGCAEKDKCSQNYFESMFHPLYYKMFRCKREYCNFSQFCPFYHSEEEKKTWDRVFSNFVRKDRISYVKDKQKYYEHNANHVETRQAKLSNDHSNGSDLSNSPTTPKTPNNNNNRKYQHKSNRKPRTPMNEGNGSPTTPDSSTWRSNRPSASERKAENRRLFNNARKDSGESNGETSSPVSFNLFYNRKPAIANRVC